MGIVVDDQKTEPVTSQAVSSEKQSDSGAKVTEPKSAKGLRVGAKRSETRQTHVVRPSNQHATTPEEKSPDSEVCATQDGPLLSSIPMPRMLPPGSPEVWASARAAPLGSVQASIFARRMVVDLSPEKLDDTTVAKTESPAPRGNTNPPVQQSVPVQQHDGSNTPGGSSTEKVKGDSADSKNTISMRASSNRARGKPPKEEMAAATLSSQISVPGLRCVEAVGTAPHRPCRQGKQRRNRRYGTQSLVAARESVPSLAEPDTFVSVASPDSASPPMLILNCEDIGRSAARCPFFRDMHLDFIWQAVEKAITHYEKRGWLLHNVCRAATTRRWPPPAHIDAKLIKCPVIDEFPEPERHFVARLVDTYKCPVVDNRSYRGKAEFRKDTTKIEYVIDAEGAFVPLREP